MVTIDLQTLNLKLDQVMFNSLVLTWQRNFEVTFGIFSVLVFQISVLESYLDEPRENEAIKHDLVEFKVQCLKVFCYHGNKSTILLFYSIFRTTSEVASKLYFVEICQVSEKLWFFNHKRAEFWFPNFGFKVSLLSLLNFCL